MPDLEAYFARLDTHLAQLDPDNRAWFLEKLSAQWCDRYVEWQRRVAQGHPVTANATDFLNTIAELDRRAASNPTAEACAELRAWQRRRHLRVVA